MSAGARIRVVQWGTGNTGTRALREIIRHPGIELVGVRVYSPDKDGLDAGDLCGEPHTGVRAATDSASIHALGADCVVYMPRATGSGASRAGLTQKQVLDDVLPFLEAGTNVITTVSDFVAYGVRLSDADRDRALKACETGQASVYSTGSDPGFITDVLPLALLSLQRQVELVEIEEFGDVSRRPSPHMVMEQMRFGKPVADFDLERREEHLYGEYQPALAELADAAGLAVDRWTTAGSVAAAAEDTTIVAGEIAAGTVGAQRVVIAGDSGGSEVIRFVQYVYVTTELDPPWDVRSTGWRIRVRGEAPLDVDLVFPVAPEEIADYVPAYNANRGINAIPYVCAAAPGFLSDQDLPAITPTGPRSRRQ